MKDHLAADAAAGEARATSLSRVLAAALAAAGATTLARDAATLGQAATPDAGQEVTVLIVQPCGGGRAHQAMGDSARYRIDLTDQPGISLYFSDRPERITGLIKTADLLAEPGLFGTDPPNAALAFQRDQEDSLGLVTLELISGEINPAIDAVSYQANVLPIDDLAAGEASDQVELVEALPATFGHAWLFIDGVIIPGGRSTHFPIPPQD